MKFEGVDQVVKWRICTGCGACVAICQHHNIRLIDMPSDGLRPVVDVQKCEKCHKCLNVCPGVGMEHQPFSEGTIVDLRQAWGPVLELWEGYATDPEIRFEGSSGGVATALALFCIEKENFTGVLHTGTKPEAPMQNIPVFSRSREDLLKHTGSRYSPSAPCEKLNWIEEADSPCVFIGKPCDVAALRKSQVVNPNLGNKVGLAIGIFCAGTPSTVGTYKLLDTLDVKPEEVGEIRYRGHGWPGMTTVKVRESEQTYQMTYDESWGGILSKNVQVRCRLCPDGTGEFADISCGDPWYRKVEPDEPGRSLILVRTERGREVLQKVIQADYVKLEQVEPDVLLRSQNSLLKRRRHLWGRLLAMRAIRIPVPHFEGFSLFSNWRDLSAGEKIRSIGGTLKRIYRRNWSKPLDCHKEG